MAGLDSSDWLCIWGLGALWLGWQIVAVGGLPRALRPRDEPAVAPGSPEAFGRFWIDQYGFIGLTLVAVGIALAAWAAIA
jgi:hypothetical protein